MATFADVTGQKLRDDEAPDSISSSSLLSHPTGPETRTHLVMESTMHFAIREGDWKLCLSPASGITALSENGAGNDPLPDMAWKTAREQFGRTPKDGDLLKAPFVQLYNLSDDPAESNNLAAELPDRVQQLVALLQKQVENGRSTPGTKLENDKPVTIVTLKDKRLPKFVKDWATLNTHER